METKFKRGDKVECNGNKEARVLGYYMDDPVKLVNVRLWDGFRHIGDVCVGESEIKRLG